MKNLKRILYRFFKLSWPFIFLLTIVCVFFWKTILLKQVALPADILVHELYPVKNPIVSDAVSFSYPMRYLVIKDWKNGVVPLWNPYILFGIPLLANFQSAAFSITNIFYFFTDFNSGWNLQIISQHVFACVFMYVLLRHWKISKLGSILGSISFGFGGFNLIWSEWNAHALTASYIPILIFFADRSIEKRKVYDGILLSIFLALQFFSGYPQIIIYTIPSILLLWITRYKIIDKKFLFTGVFLLFFIFLGIGLSAIQVLPGVELLKLSQRSNEGIPKSWAFLTARQVITFIAPDFFGNHATNNYWGDKNYTSNIGFVGVISFTLSLISIKYFKKRREIVYLIFLVIVSLILSFQTPVGVFLWNKNILGLKAGASYRILVLFSFSISGLAAFGYDFLSNQKNKLFGSMIVFVLLFVFWIYGYSIHNSVALRNLILPTVIFGLMIIIFWKTKIKFLLLFLMLVELFYFGWKFTPFVPRSIVFPDNNIVKQLSKINGLFRVVGGDEIPVDTNMVYGLSYASGYDAEYPSTIAKFLGVLNSNDAFASPQDRYGLVTNKNSKLVNLGNIRFFLDNGKIIENKNYLPRSFYVNNWVIEKDESKILSTLLDSKFLINKKIILNENVEINKGSNLYFVSDTYYPGWKAYVNGIETKIYQADFAFRAIEVPKGVYDVKMLYLPESFLNGLKVSFGSLGILVIIGICRRKF